MDKIKKFIYPANSYLSNDQNLKVRNRSDYHDMIAQSIFYSIDEFAKRRIIDLFNLYGDKLFQDNQLNIVADQQSIEKMFSEHFRKQGHEITTLSNPEMIYKAFNFIKPSNLIPGFSRKLYLIKQLGVSEIGSEKLYLINPYFFGFLVSFDIYLHNVFCSNYHQTLEDGLIRIFSDCYGNDYGDLFQYVAYTSHEFAKEGNRKRDANDETFTAGVQKISGLTDAKIFHNFIYHPSMVAANKAASVLQQ